MKLTRQQVAAAATAVAIALGGGGGLVAIKGMSGATSSADAATDAHAAQLRVLRLICVQIASDEAGREACRQ